MHVVRSEWFLPCGSKPVVQHKWAVTGIGMAMAAVEITLELQRKYGRVERRDYVRETTPLGPVYRVITCSY